LTEELYPKVVMIENVPDLAKYTRYADFKRRLRRLDYEVNDAVLDVANYGVPQRCKRLVLASRLGSLAHPLPTKIKRTGRAAIAGLPRPDRSADPLHNLKEARSERIQKLIKRIPKDGGSRTDLPDTYTLPCPDETDGYYDVYGRMSWDEVSPTITGGCINPSKGRFLHPEGRSRDNAERGRPPSKLPAEIRFLIKKRQIRSRRDDRECIATCLFEDPGKGYKITPGINISRSTLIESGSMEPWYGN
jgi:site-specific DNA-cytosine methylase